MQFNPPMIENIKDVLPVIKDNPAFVVKEKGWYTVVDYMYMTDKLFHDPIERECRGLKFCTTSGRLLARPYHKFHNLNERPAFATDKVDLTQGHAILDKLDGSMVHTCPSPLGIYLMTRMGVTEVAEQADKFLNANPVKYSRLLNALPIDLYTYIFEYVGPNNKIVLDYKEEDLILTAIRNNANGTYVFHDELVALGKAFGVTVVKAFDPLGETESFADFVEDFKVYDKGDSEGVVIRFDTGEMIKLKCDEYVRKHRSKDLVSSQKGILQLILDGAVDDVIPQLDPEVAKKVQAYETAINDLIDIEAAMMLGMVNDGKELSQKDFAIGIAKFRKDTQSLLFTIRKGDDARETVVKQLLRNNKTNKAITELLEQKGWPLWTFSFFQEE
jgi:RNA ligase